jgi:hypothetical protein
LNPLALLHADDDVNRGDGHVPLRASFRPSEPLRIPGVRGVRAPVEKALQQLDAGDAEGTREVLDDLLADLGDAVAEERAMPPTRLPLSTRG